MEAAKIIAGYTLGGADMLRRAMGKKDAVAMARERTKFVEGAKRVNNIDEKTANSIFDILNKFAGYGFNKSHSAAYALIAYQTAWLKAHYPVEFMAALLTSEAANTDKVVAHIFGARQDGIEVLLDDRGERPGVMFADLELIGIPHRITIGDRGLKEGNVDYQARRDAKATPVPVAEIAAFIRAQVAAKG